MIMLKKLLTPGKVDYDLPFINQGNHIPRIIHQTYYTYELPEEFKCNINLLKSRNPNWEYRFYDDNDILEYISCNYGSTILEYYNRINPIYGAARADFFRYLVIYKDGGVYLDIKSNCKFPFDEVLYSSDRYILAYWSNEKGQARERFGHWKELNHMPRGEFQQWHIIAAAGHPFLKAVILSVMNNIDTYRPWVNGVAQRGVLNLSGPIAYSLSILPILDKYKYRIVGNESEFGLIYNALDLSHLKVISKPHYRSLNGSVVLMTGYKSILSGIYITLRKAIKFILMS